MKNEYPPEQEIRQQDYIYNGIFENEREGGIMGKEQRVKKETKKAPQKSKEEKKAIKKEKKKQKQ